jgi:CubicO group peptidase (beta-lactamase class C family)
MRRLVQRKVPGLSVLVTASDRLLAGGAAGVSNISSRTPATVDTVYLWFSMTKLVTATAAMLLVEQGRLSLDDAVKLHLPAFPTPRDGWPEVRVRHLLSHSSGLANPIPVTWVHPASEAGRDPHGFAVELLRRYSRLRFAAGSKASYSNLGYIALGEVITSSSGQRYEDFVREHILRPLGMARTDFTYRPDMTADAATGYQSRLNPLTPLLRRMLPKGIVGENHGRFLAFRPFCVDGAAYGGLVGPPRDAARFLSAHLNGRRHDGVRLLSATSVEQMQKITATGRKMDVGLGWFRRHSDGTSTDHYLEHLGGGGGFFSMMRVYPDRGLGVIVMGNSSGYDHQRIASAAIARARGAPDA